MNVPVPVCFTRTRTLFGSVLKVGIAFTNRENRRSDPKSPYCSQRLTRAAGVPLALASAALPISMFYGIIICMYFFDSGKHKKPHIHVKYQGDEAVVAIPVYLSIGSA